MIEVVSSPADLTTWRPDTQPFYLEVFGEAEPLLDTAFAEVVPAGEDNAATTTDAPVYEYWWTLGHPGAQKHAPAWSDDVMSGCRPDAATDPVWRRLGEPAALVYLYFPISGGWRIKEVTTTVKYLSPVRDQRQWWNKAGEDLKALLPLLDTAGQVAQVFPPAAAAGKVMSALAKAQLGSVPQDDKDFAWYTEKVTFGSEHGVMQGIVWTLPKKMFDLLGGRLTGSVLLSFIPARIQPACDQPPAAWQPQPMAALAHAVVYDEENNPTWIPGPDGHEFIKLQLRPRTE